MRALSGLLFLLVAALPYALMLGTATGPDLPARTADTRQLTVLSPHRREVRMEYSRAFTAWMQRTHGSSVSIQWLDAGGTSKILKDMESRFATSPDAPGVDLLFGGGLDPYLTAVEKGWLTTITPPAADMEAIPARCAGNPVYDPQGRWFGVALSGFGILYNRVLTERMRLPTPATWEDLGNPAYFSWVGSGDPRSSGSVHMCYEIILQAYGFAHGWDLITRMCANVRRFGESGGAVPLAVSAGDVAAGMAIDQYAQTIISSTGGDVLRFALPVDATVINPDCIGIVTNGPAPDLARLFVDFALSEEGQRILFQPPGANGQRSALYRMPVRKSLYDTDAASIPARPYEYETSFVYDTALGSRRWRLVNDLIGAWMIDSHADLARAWKAVIDGGMNPDLVRALCAAPVNEEELDGLVKECGDPRRRIELLSDWNRAAAERYRDIRARAAGRGDT